MDVVKLAMPPMFGSIPVRHLPARRIPVTGQVFDQYLTTPAVQTRPTPAYYTVQEGDSLWRICRDTLSALGAPADGQAVHEAISKVATANRLSNPNVLHVGDRLNLSVLYPPSNPVQIKTVVTPTASASPPVRPALDWSLIRDDRKTTLAPPALIPRKPVLASTRTDEWDREITEAIVRRAAPIEYKKTDPAAQQPWGTLVKDASARLTSGFGKRKDPFTGLPEQHHGIDIAAPRGTPVYPLQEGEVVFSGWNGSYGRAVIIRHQDGSETRYAHASRTLVKAGDYVTSDTVIAHVGSSGRATGPHLHFEYRVNGKPTDPMAILDKKPVGRLQVASRL